MTTLVSTGTNQGAFSNPWPIAGPSTVTATGQLLLLTYFGVAGANTFVPVDPAIVVLGSILGAAGTSSSGNNAWFCGKPTDASDVSGAPQNYPATLDSSFINQSCSAVYDLGAGATFGAVTSQLGVRPKESEPWDTCIQRALLPLP